jgi:hypothetical protein
LYTVPAFHSLARCPCLVHGVQSLFIRMATILMLAHCLFCDLCSQFECPRVAACSHCFFLLPVLGFEL